MKHLTDNIIQEYLDSFETLHSEHVEEHLLLCSSCRDKFEKYQELYEHLTVEPEMELGSDFNQIVIRKLEVETTKQGVSMSLLCFAAVLAVFMILFTLDQIQLISISGIITSIYGHLLAWFVPTTESLSKLIAKLNGNLAVLVFAGGAAALFHLFDRMIIRSRFKGL